GSLDSLSATMGRESMAHKALPRALRYRVVASPQILRESLRREHLFSLLRLADEERRHAFDGIDDRHALLRPEHDYQLRQAVGLDALRRDHRGTLPPHQADAGPRIDD